MSNVTRLKTQTSISDGVSTAEWEARVDLAAAHRYAEHSGWTDLIFNHFTMRVPGEPRHFLVKAHNLFFEEVTAIGECGSANQKCGCRGSKCRRPHG